MNYNNTYPVSKFFVKVIFIILFILLITWLFTKYTSNKEIYKEKTSKELIFTKNLNAIKKAALKYYNEEIINQISYNNQNKITLKKLINNKHLKNIKDHNNIQCDLSNSYILLDKNKNNTYIMKISFSCNELHDIVSFNLVHNDKCETYLCESTKIDNNEQYIDEKNNLLINNNDDNNVNVNDNKNKSVSTKKSKRRETISYKGNIEITDTTNNKYRYQYVNKLHIKYTNWLNWEKIGDVSCNDKNIVCDDSKICIKEEQIKKYINNQKYITNKVSLQSIGNKVIKGCKNTNYIFYNNKLYQTNSEYSNLNNWIYIGRFLYKNPPNDTLNFKYIYYSIDYSKCNNICNGNEQYYYDKFMYENISISKFNCIDYELKRINIYSYIQNNIINYRNEEDNYRCYKEIRTRNIVDNNQYVWSNYENKQLLDNGYEYTGKKELLNK